MLLKTFKYRIYPQKATAQIIDNTIETCRRLYNRELEFKIKKYQEEQVLIGRKDIQHYVQEQRKIDTYLQAVYTQVLHEVGIRMIKSYDNFFRRVKLGNEKPGFPKFKGRQHYDSFCYTQGGFKVENNTLRLSMIGDIKIRLHRPIGGKIKTCTIIRKNDKYYVCFSCEAEAKPLPATGSSIGIDVGVTDYCITSNGDFFPKLNGYRKAEKRLKYLQRQVSRRKKSSKRRNKAVLLLARQHEKVANQRKDIAHKVSTELIKNNDLIAHEDLQIKNMVHNQHLAKSINDAGWNKLFEFLAYKASDAGRKVIPVPPAYTSQICSGCGEMVHKKLSERWHNCPYCKLSLHRDVNAARNILQIALSLM